MADVEAPALSGALNIISMTHVRVYYPERDHVGGAGGNVSYDVTWTGDSSVETVDFASPSIDVQSGRRCPLFLVEVTCLGTGEKVVYRAYRCDFPEGGFGVGGWIYDETAFTWRTSIDFAACAGDVRVKHRVVDVTDAKYDLDLDGRFTGADVTLLSAAVGLPSDGELQIFDFNCNGEIDNEDYEVAGYIIDSGLSAGTFGDVDGNGRLSCADKAAADPLWGAVAGDAAYCVSLDFDVDGDLDASDEEEFDSIAFYRDADINQDGIVEFADYLAYLDLYAALDRKADMNGDGIVEFADYLAFLTAYEDPVTC